MLNSRIRMFLTSVPLLTALCILAPAASAQVTSITVKNIPNSLLRQIRAADGGANHISVTVSSGTAYFTGNVIKDYYRAQLQQAARSCGARTGIIDNLRVGR